MDILSIKDLIRRHLEAKKENREDDRRLVANVWYRELKSRLNQMSAMDLLRMIANDDLPNYESITRASRQLQMKYPELRGDNYKERQKEQTKIKEQLKQF